MSAAIRCATGQVYAARKPIGRTASHPPYYLYPAGTPMCRISRYQMPVEECGNMLIMLEAAPRLWRGQGTGRSVPPAAGQLGASYLVQYGEDPGEQLCTDDFAGHLAHNVNLAAKAIVGVACYARLTGDESCTAQAQDDGRPTCWKKSAIRATPR